MNSQPSVVRCSLHYVRSELQFVVSARARGILSAGGRSVQFRCLSVAKFN